MTELEEQINKISTEYAEWFQEEHIPHRTRLECFFRDCEIKDEKFRKDAILKWVGNAFEFGYKKGMRDDYQPL